MRNLKFIFFMNRKLTTSKNTYLKNKIRLIFSTKYLITRCTSILESILELPSRRKTSHIWSTITTSHRKYIHSAAAFCQFRKSSLDNLFKKFHKSTIIQESDDSTLGDKELRVESGFYLWKMANIKWESQNACICIWVLYSKEGKEVKRVLMDSKLICFADLTGLKVCLCAREGQKGGFHVGFLPHR